MSIAMALMKSIELTEEVEEIETKAKKEENVSLEERFAAFVKLAHQGMQPLIEALFEENNKLKDEVHHLRQVHLAGVKLRINIGRYFKKTERGYRLCDLEKYYREKHERRSALDRSIEEFDEVRDWEAQQ